MVVFGSKAQWFNNKTQNQSSPIWNCIRNCHFATHGYRGVCEVKQSWHSSPMEVPCSCCSWLQPSAPQGGPGLIFKDVLTFTASHFHVCLQLAWVEGDMFDFFWSRYINTFYSLSQYQIIALWIYRSVYIYMYIYIYWF